MIILILKSKNIFLRKGKQTHLALSCDTHDMDKVVSLAKPIKSSELR